MAPNITIRHAPQKQKRKPRGNATATRRQPAGVPVPGGHARYDTALAFVTIKYYKPQRIRRDREINRPHPGATRSSAPDSCCSRPPRRPAPPRPAPPVLREQVIDPLPLFSSSSSPSFDLVRTAPILGGVCAWVAAGLVISHSVRR